MASQAQELAERLQALNNEMIAFVRGVSEADWGKSTKAEEWRLGVVARHVGTGHYSIIELAKMMIAGTPIPGFTQELIAQSNKAHAAKHANCTREEVLSILEAKGRKLVEYVRGLSDADLAKRANLPDFGGDISVKQLFKATLLHSAAEHLKSMRDTVTKK
ncbi:MAG: DinB family protein [Desulfobacteraceae bacterium]|nr:DinB family protein [Desulfobacteraceae bacterium]